MLKNPYSNRALFQKIIFGATASPMTQIILFSQGVASLKMCSLKTSLVCKRLYWCCNLQWPIYINKQINKYIPEGKKEKKKTDMYCHIKKEPWSSQLDGRSGPSSCHLSLSGPSYREGGLPWVSKSFLSPLPLSSHCIFSSQTNSMRTFPLTG